MEEVKQEHEEVIKGVYDKLSQETKENIENKFKELKDKELNQISGGSAIQPYADLFNWFVDTYKDFGEWTIDGIKSIYDYFFSSPEVSGPKTGLVQCQMCKHFVHKNNMTDHIINDHKDEITELIKQSGIF